MSKKLLLETDSLVNLESYKRIVKEMSSYKYESIAKAIFVLNSYLPNRNLLELCITLNYAFFNFINEGTNEINDYESFSFFVNIIKKSYKKNPFNTDIQVHDLGEVYFNFLGTNYPVIVGTGHNHSYVFNFFIEEISRVTQKNNEFKEIFKYNSIIIESIKQAYNSNLSPMNFDIILPPKEYFESMFVKYDSLLEYFIAHNIGDILCNLKHSNQLHFTRKNNNHFILYNSSIIIDYATWLLSNLNENQINSIVNQTVKTRLVEQFELSGQQEYVLHSPMIMADPKGKPIHYPITVILNKKAIYIILNENQVRDDIGFSNLEAEINSLISTNSFYIGALIGKQYKVYQFSDETKVKFIQLYNHININQMYFGKIEEDNSYHLLALDFVYFILRSIHFEQIVKFLENNLKPNKEHFGTDGLSGLFEISLNSDGMIELGAIKYGLSLTELYTPESKIVDLFSNDFRNIPYMMNDSLFGNPFLWETKEYSHNFDYVKRNGESLIGYVRKHNEVGYIFVCRNSTHMKHIDISESFFNNMKSIDDLLVYMFDKYWNLIVKLSSFKKGIQIFIIPEMRAQELKVGIGGFSGNYLFGDSYFDLPPKRARITINESLLFQEIEKTSTRDVENTFFIELLKVIVNDVSELQELEDAITYDSKLPKLTNVLKVDIPFYKNLNNLSHWAKDIDFIQIRKRIASICLKTKIRPGIYTLDKAKLIIRELQKKLIPDFISMINSYYFLDLHIQLTSLLSANEFNVYMLDKKIKADDSDIETDIATDYRKQNINNREDSKNNSRYLRYLIENNLRFGNRTSSATSQNDVMLLIAYADWLMVLQDNSDMFHWNMDSCSIEITDDYRINTIFEEKTKDKYNNLTERVYSSGTYITEKIPFIDKNTDLKEAFEEDMGFSFQNFISVLGLLSDKADEREEHEIQKDIVKYNREELVQRISSANKDINSENIIKILDSITVKPEKLSKIIRDESEDEQGIIPVWEREYRPNRFELKPLLLHNQDIIFSPFLCFQTFMLWINSLSGLFPPHESRIPKMLQVISEQRKIIQKQMVIDIYDRFIHMGASNCNKEYWLHKHGNHPIELGDYDVLIFDNVKGFIWNLECKVLQNVGSVSEFAKHQDSFFNKNGKDEKFQARIEYLVQNIEIILKDAKVEFASNYVFKHYMITNKVFISEFKDISFEIITYSELMNIIDNTYR